MGRPCVRGSGSPRNPRPRGYEPWLSPSRLPPAVFGHRWSRATRHKARPTRRRPGAVRRLGCPCPPGRADRLPGHRLGDRVRVFRGGIQLLLCSTAPAGEPAGGTSVTWVGGGRLWGRGAGIRWSGWDSGSAVRLRARLGRALLSHARLCCVCIGISRRCGTTSGSDVRGTRSSVTVVVRPQPRAQYRRATTPVVSHAGPTRGVLFVRIDGGNATRLQLRSRPGGGASRPAGSECQVQAKELLPQ